MPNQPNIKHLDSSSCPFPQLWVCPSITRRVPDPTQLSATGRLDGVSAVGTGTPRRARL